MSNEHRSIQNCFGFVGWAGSKLAVHSTSAILEWAWFVQSRSRALTSLKPASGPARIGRRGYSSSSPALHLWRNGGERGSSRMSTSASSSSSSSSSSCSVLLVDRGAKRDSLFLVVQPGPTATTRVQTDAEFGRAPFFMSFEADRAPPKHDGFQLRPRPWSQMLRASRLCRLSASSPCRRSVGRPTFGAC